jgi:hypothetical protein
MWGKGPHLPLRMAGVARRLIGLSGASAWGLSLAQQIVELRAQFVYGGGNYDPEVVRG